MTHLRRRKLIGIVLLMVGVSCSAVIILYALRQNINLFYTPSQVFAGEAPINHPFRLGGLVKKNSVHHNKTDLQVSFSLTDNIHEIQVSYNGILPDLFREGKGAIVEGEL